jgi:hypothetical protein
MLFDFKSGVSVFALSALLVSPAMAVADVYVIANSGVQIGAGDVREVFLGNMQFAGGAKVQPVDNGPAQVEFLSKVLKMEPDRYNTAWTKKTFRDGVNAPSVKSGDAEVVEFVKRTPGAVGYVTSAPSGVTVIQKY